MNCEKKMLNIYRQGKTFTDQFYVDEDYNVPDTKADIREIIEGDAVMEEIDLKLVENYIRITGRLAFQVLYVLCRRDFGRNVIFESSADRADCQSDPFPENQCESDGGSNHEFGQSGK